MHYRKFIDISFPEEVRQYLHLYGQSTHVPPFLVNYSKYIEAFPVEHIDEQPAPLKNCPYSWHKHPKGYAIVPFIWLH